MEVSGFPEGHEGDGQPSPNDIAKAASSDGTGPRAHGDFGLHEHGEPTFSDAEMAMLEAKGLDVDHHHGRVYDATGFLLSPGTVGASAVDVGGKAPGEAARTEGPVAVQHLDLRGGWPGPS